MKRLTTTLIGVALLLPGLAIAKTPDAGVSPSPTPSVSPSTKPTPTPASNLPTPTPAVGKLGVAEQAAHLAALKARGQTEITRRLSALTSAQAAVAATTKLSAADKTTLTAQLKTESTGLTALNTKLAADTTLDAARTDVQSIIADYRVFALMLPKARLVAAADSFENIGDQLNQIAHSLQASINTEKTAGKDTTAAQADLTALENQLNAARLAYTGLADKVINLDPADYDANHAILVADRSSLETARTNLKSARADVDTTLAAIKALQ